MPSDETPKKCGNRECHNSAGQPDKPRSLYCSKKCQSREQNLRQGRIKGTKKNKKEGEAKHSPPLHHAEQRHAHKNHLSTGHHNVGDLHSPEETIGPNGSSVNTKHSYTESYETLKKKKIEAPRQMPAHLHSMANYNASTKAEFPATHHMAHHFIPPESTEAMPKGRSPYSYSNYNLPSITNTSQPYAPNYLSMTPSPTLLPSLLGDHESTHLNQFSPLQLTSKPPNHPNIINPKAVKDAYPQQHRQQPDNPYVKREGLPNEDKRMSPVHHPHPHSHSQHQDHRTGDPAQQQNSSLSTGPHNANQSDTPTPGGSPFSLTMHNNHLNTHSPFPPRGISPFGNNLPLPKTMIFEHPLDETPLQEPPSSKNMRFRKTPTPPIPPVVDFPDPNLCFSGPYPSMRRSVSPFSLSRNMTPPNSKSWDGTSPLTINPFGPSRQKLSIPEIPEIKSEIQYHSYE